MVVAAKEKNLEEDMENRLVSDGGLWRVNDKQSTVRDENGNLVNIDDRGYKEMPGKGIDITTLVDFIKATQPKAWKRFLNICNGTTPEKKFFAAFQKEVDTYGIARVLRKGFKYRGIVFKVLFAKPESTLNATDTANYEANTVRCIRQFHYAATGNKTVDVVIDVNGIPVIGVELKDQFTGQTYENAEHQWRTDRDPREECFRFNNRMIAFIAADMSYVTMSTRLAGEDTYFLPLNQGSNGAGNDGGMGNPADEDYPASHLWEKILTRDSVIDILVHFLHLEVKDEKIVDANGNERTITKRTLIFPRYHQLDVVRKLVDAVKSNGPGENYLIQHSAGSGKSNSIAWAAYRLAGMHDSLNNPMFSSVVIVTDRVNLDSQIQETVGGMNGVEGKVVLIDEKCNSKDLKDAINAGKRIIVSTLQKYSQIYSEVESEGRNFAVIVDEAHSSQTGSHAIHLKSALADITDPLREWAEYEDEWEDEEEKIKEKMAAELAAHGRHSNITFLAFTATPKPQTLELFGTRQPDGKFIPWHVYSMRQAVEEGFILDPLANYVTYREACEIARTVPENDEVPTSATAKLLRKYKELHPYVISQKAEIIVETFRTTTRNAIKGRGKMMVVTASRLATVRYYHEIKRYMESKGYDDMEILVAFSSTVKDPKTGAEYSEPGMNIGHDGKPVKESQTKEEFRNYGDILVVAEKYQTGFDEPLLHTLVIDKKLRDVKAVQTICRIDRICKDKEDTYVLDFVNDRDKIEEAFARYYTRTILEDEVNIDLIYKTQEELRAFGVYDDSEIEGVANIQYGDDREHAQGIIVSLLKPAVMAYGALDEEKRYQFRRKVRSFCKWYAYATQIVRTFDKQLHKEYVYLCYLRNLLAADTITVESVEDKVELRYYQLKKIGEGSIDINPSDGVQGGSVHHSESTLDKRMDPLQVIIDRINEEYSGEFSDDDVVVMTMLYNRFSKDPEVKASVQRDGEKIFTSSVFPHMFEEEAMNAYLDSSEAFKSLFEDKQKYEVVMGSLARMLVELNRIS